MTELILVRHGQSQANAAGRWEGRRGDAELTYLGQAQAEATARQLAIEGEIAALYTSPLRRASQTATIISTALGLRPASEDDLKEIDFGDLDGVTSEEMETLHPEVFVRWKDRTDMEFRWPGGERRADFFRRVTRACDQILKRHSSDKVVIVAHGGTIRACLAHLLPDQLGEWWGYTLKNCSITRISVDGNGIRLIALDDKAHLSAVTPPS
jgi:broad specificity phosphatase PhoE